MGQNGRPLGRDLPCWHGSCYVHESGQPGSTGKWHGSCYGTDRANPAPPGSGTDPATARIGPTRLHREVARILLRHGSANPAPPGSGTDPATARIGQPGSTGKWHGSCYGTDRARTDRVPPIRVRSPGIVAKSERKSLISGRWTVESCTRGEGWKLRIGKSGGTAPVPKFLTTLSLLVMFFYPPPRKPTAELSVLPDSTP